MNWLDNLTNWRQFVLQTGALGVSWLLMGALLWAGWTLLDNEINYLHQELEQARQDRQIITLELKKCLGN